MNGSQRISRHGLGDELHQQRPDCYSRPQEVLFVFRHVLTVGFFCPAGVHKLVQIMSVQLPTPMQIELSQGLFALVSPEDFSTFNAWRWHAAKCNGRFYARRSVARKGQSPRAISMHREVPTVRGAALVDHINGDSLDNRRQNLRAATFQQNAFNLQGASFKDGLRGVFLQKGRYIARIGAEYGGSFESQAEAAFEANRILDRMSPGTGYRNPIDFDALIAKLKARRRDIDSLIACVEEARHAA